MKARVAGHGSAQQHYADRGISADPRWLESFEAFRYDMGECPPDLELEREDNDKGYYKDNCCWATRGDQMRNTRRTHHVVVGGQRMCLLDGCRKIGANYRTAMKRMKAGWTAQQVIDYEVKVK